MATATTGSNLSTAATQTAAATIDPVALEGAREEPRSETIETLGEDVAAVVQQGEQSYAYAAENIL